MKKKICEALVKANVVRFGEFTLVSGAKSPIYVDMRVLPSFPESFDTVTNELAKLVKSLEHDVVAGIESAGIPLSTAVALKNKTPMIYIRKKPKDYGTKSRIEGFFKEGQKVVLIDDLITGGTSKIPSIEALREQGAIVDDVAIILDRGQGGEDILFKNKVTLRSLVTLKDVLRYMVDEKHLSQEQYESVLKYLDG